MSKKERLYNVRLSDLIKYIDCRLAGQDVSISGIEYDSRRVMPGNLFCCIVGTYKDGHEYAHMAVERGAAALVVQHELPIKLPQIVVSDARAAMAQLSAAYYGFPASGLRIVGITGTNGKTSSTYMLKSIAEKAGYKVGLIGTIRNMIGSRCIDTERTTPESVDLQKLLRQMKDENVDLVVMEVSSHSLDQGRVHGIRFEIGEFTNLTQDHLDYHKTIDNYLAAKKRHFLACGTAVVNADDAYAKKMTDGLDIPVVTFGIREKAKVFATNIEITEKGVSFDLNAKGFRGVPVRVPIPGLFSVFNALGVAAIALEMGMPIEAVQRGVEEMGSVSGRLEPLPTNGREFSVILDFAHTPDALVNILSTAREFAKGRIVTVFGCGGDRDKAKRPIMGETAGRLSDFLVVTSDNPRTEDPNAIIASIVEGVKKSGCEYVVIENRRKAIRYAIENAQRNDVIILAGKGHENYQEINGVKSHFDEKEIVAELMKEPTN